MATFTTNYNLRKPADGDFIENDTDLNANFDIIDTEMKQSEDAIADLVAIDAKTRYVLKQTTESVVSSTTPQADDELLFTVVADKQYVFELHIFIGGQGLKSGWDWQYDFTFPAGTFASATISPSFNGISAGGNIATDMNVWAEAGITSSPSTTKSVGASDDTHVYAIITGSFFATANGTVTLRWSQRVSSANQINVQKGSWMKVVQVN